MNRNLSRMIAALLGLGTLAGPARAQHLWWDAGKDNKNATCVYGEIEVLATHWPIYYCGVNWHPGAPAGGYCGIQHNREKERRTIFSIWDTSPTLHPKTTQADPKTVTSRFGGEGTGGHTHMLWNWKERETFQFFVRKQPGATPGTTDARYYVFDRDTNRWLHSATITCPNGDKKQAESVTTIGGGMNSFLENFGGKDKDVPKIALYRLWLGTEPGNLKHLTKAGGDGTWGQLHDDYFLAEGDPQKLDAAFAKLKKDYGKPTFGQKGEKLNPITEKPLPKHLVKQLEEKLPTAPPLK
jgi:hypothetical protein